MNFRNCCDAHHISEIYIYSDFASPRFNENLNPQDPFLFPQDFSWSLIKSKFDIFWHIKSLEKNK